MKKQIFKHAKKFLPFIGLALLILYIIFHLELNDPVRLNEAKTYILTILSSIFLPIAIILTIPRVMIRNCAWQMIFKQQKIKIGFFQSLKIFLIGYFYGSFTPGYYGQLMRIPYLKQKTGEPYGKLFVNTLIEINVRGFSIYLIILFGVILFFGEEPKYHFIIYLILIYVVAFLLVTYYFIKKERGERVFKLLVKFFIPKKLKKDFKNFILTFYQDFPKIRKLVFPVFLSFLTWIIIFTQYYLLIIPLGLEINYFVFLTVFPIANVAGFIPITIAGIGTREITAITILTFLYPEVTSLEIFVIAIMGFLITDVLTGFSGFFLSLTEVKNKSPHILK